MKLIAIALIALSMPAYADEGATDLMGQMSTMAQCQAIELSLMHQDNQIAASITALSPTPPQQLALLRDSYRAMAKDEQTKVQAMVKITKEVILPQFPGDTAGQHFVAALGSAIEAVQTALGVTDYDAQVKVQAKLLGASHDCEAFVTHLDRASTF